MQNVVGVAHILKQNVVIAVDILIFVLPWNWVDIGQCFAFNAVTDTELQ